MNVLHQSHRDRDPVFAAQVELLYRAAPEAFLVTVVNALLLTYVQRDIVASTVLITWLIFMLTVTAARTVLSGAIGMQPRARSHFTGGTACMCSEVCAPD